MMWKFGVLAVAVIAVSATVSCAEVDDEELDPFDMIEFDSTNMKMKKNATARKPQTDQSTKEQDKTESDTLKTDRESGSAQKTEQNSPKELKPPESACVPPVNQQPKAEKEEYCPALSLFQQFVSRLLRFINGKVSQLGAQVPTELCLRMHMTYYQVEMLENFKRDHSKDSVFTAHDILNEAVQGVHVLSHSDPSVHDLWVEKYFGVTMEKAQQILMVITCSVLLAVVLPKVRWTWMLVGVFVVSVGITWNRLYKKEVAKQHDAMMKDIPAGCRKLSDEEQGIWSAIRNYMTSQFTFQQDACTEYYERLLTDPSVMVTPLDAVAVTVVQTLLKPLHTVGTAISEFIRALLKDLPVQWQFITIILVFAFLVLILLLTCGYRIRIPFFLSIEPSLVRREDEVQALKDTIRQLQATIQDRQQSASQPQRYQTVGSLSVSAPNSTTMTITGPAVSIGDGDPHDTPSLTCSQVSGRLPASTNEYSLTGNDQPGQDEPSLVTSVRQTSGFGSADSVSASLNKTQLKAVQTGQVTAEGSLAASETQVGSLSNGSASAPTTDFESAGGSLLNTQSFSFGALGLSKRDPEMLGPVEEVGDRGDANVPEVPPSPTKD